MHGGTDGRTAVVVANGILPDLALFAPLLAAADVVVAADGGARALLQAGWRPTTILGDMDSLPPDLLATWCAGGGETLVFPPEKDETDLELGLRYVVQRGACRVAVLGALGGRVDHELANLLLLAAPLLDGIDAAVLDRRTRVVAIKDKLELAGRPGDLLSFLPVTASAAGIVTEGLKYRLNGDTLLLGPARGVSNVFVQERITVRLAAGVLLAVHTWPDDRPLAW
jgi:thiamine pyrophosphokinase